MFDKVSSKVRAIAGAVVVSFVAVAPAMAQGSTDPTTGIVTTLGTYLADVGLLASAVLLIFYGKKLVSYLRV